MLNRYTRWGALVSVGMLMQLFGGCSPAFDLINTAILGFIAFTTFRLSRNV